MPLQDIGGHGLPVSFSVISELPEILGKGSVTAAHCLLHNFEFKVYFLD